MKDFWLAAAIFVLGFATVTSALCGYAYMKYGLSYPFYFAVIVSLALPALAILMQALKFFK